MKSILLSLGACLAVAGLVFGTTQEEKEGVAGKAGWMPPQAGVHHNHLKALAGEWEYTGWMQMMPGVPKQEIGGDETSEVTCNGLWLKGHYVEKKGQAFEGYGFIGYDSKKKKYVSTWVDSMIDFHSSSEGTCSEDGTVWTMWTEMDCPMTGKMIKMKGVTQLTDANTKVLTMAVVDEKGNETVTMELTAKRKKSS